MNFHGDATCWSINDRDLGRRQFEENLALETSQHLRPQQTCDTWHEFTTQITRDKDNDGHCDTDIALTQLLPETVSVTSYAAI